MIKYANLHTMLEHDSVYKIAMSLRGDGKTTELKVIALESFFDCGKASIFSRRFETEFTQDFFDGFFDDVKNAKRQDLLNGHKYVFKTQKKATTLFCDDKKCMSFIALSRAGRLKSTIGYNTHRNIFIDEYIPLDNRYLKNEVTLIAELYKTIDRRHDENYIMIACNRVDRFNPIFSAFNIENWHKGRNFYCDGLIELLSLSDVANIQTDENTRIGRLMSKTDYNNYQKGEFLNNKIHLIKQRQGLTVFCYIAHKNRLYGVFIVGNELVVDKVANKRYEVPTICLNAENPKYNAVSLKIAHEIRELLAEYKYNNALFFDNELYYNELKDLYNYI